MGGNGDATTTSPTQNKTGGLSKKNAIKASFHSRLLHHFLNIWHLVVFKRFHIGTVGSH